MKLIIFILLMLFIKIVIVALLFSPLGLAFAAWLTWDIITTNRSHNALN